MGSSRTLGGIFCMTLLGTLILSNHAINHYNEAFPPLSVSLASPVARLSDFAGIAMGFRRLTSDIAWIQTLVYYGAHEDNTDGEAAEQGGGNYPLFLAYCERVAHIDSNFLYVYYYGAGVLGWNLNRLDQAENLLKDGIYAHPKEWRFQQYLAAMSYQKNHNISKLTEFLQAFVEQKDCPNILRSILANIYKKQRRYLEAIKIWSMVYDTKDPIYSARAISQIKELYPLAKETGPKAY